MFAPLDEPCGSSGAVLGGGSLRCKFAPLDEPCGSSGAVLGGGLVAMGDVPIAGAVAGAVAGGLERKASAVTSAILILVAGQWMRT